MKIAISTDDKDMDASLDQRFGRSNFFLIVEIEDKKITNNFFVENKGSINEHGAGIKSAEQLGELNVDAVITGHLGPNASKILSQLQIKAYNASGEIKDVLQDFMSDRCKKIIQTSKPNNNSFSENSNITNNKTDDKPQIIFFPLLDNIGKDSRISPHFGHAPFFGIYTAQTGIFKVIDNNLDHKNPSKNPIEQIEELVSPTIIFAKGIGSRAIQIIKSKGICVKTGNYDTVNEVLENLDNLDEQFETCKHDHDHGHNH